MRLIAAAVAAAFLFAAVPAMAHHGNVIEHQEWAKSKKKKVKKTKPAKAKPVRAVPSR